MSESVEQAALRRATDWEGHARREAAAILNNRTVEATRSHLTELLAVAWLQGAIYGSHETLGRAEVAFENLRAAL